MNDKKNKFVDAIILIARQKGYIIEINRSGLRQIDFGNKKLHEGHLRDLYPDILNRDINLRSLIEKVAPGRGCSVLPMREIMEVFHSSYSK